MNNAVPLAAARRVTLFAGHYGSGKTTIAVNWALALRASGLDTAIVDLDIVNPYFRTRDASALLEEAGVRLIASPFAGTNVDAPALPAAAYAAVENKALRAVLDVGGDDRGALALGRYVPYLQAENDYAFLCVINRFRPLTSTVADTLSVMAEIQAACGLRFTGLVSNSNLGRDTTDETVRSSLPYARDVSAASGLPLVCVCAPGALGAQLCDIPHFFPLRQAMKSL